MLQDTSIGLSPHCQTLDAHSTTIVNGFESRQPSRVAMVTSPFSFLPISCLLYHIGADLIGPFSRNVTHPLESDASAQTRGTP